MINAISKNYLLKYLSRFWIGFSNILV